jgi:hypothetical protein
MEGCSTLYFATVKSFETTKELDTEKGERHRG